MNMNNYSSRSDHSSNSKSKGRQKGTYLVS